MVFIVFWRLSLSNNKSFKILWFLKHSKVLGCLRIISIKTRITNITRIKLDIPRQGSKMKKEMFVWLRQVLHLILDISVDDEAKSLVL